MGRPFVKKLRGRARADGALPPRPLRLDDRRLRHLVGAARRRRASAPASRSRPTRNGDKVGLVAFGDGVERYVPAEAGASATRCASCATCSRCPPPPARTDPAPALELVARAVRRRAVVFLVSDFLHDGLERARWRSARGATTWSPCACSRPSCAAPSAGLVRVADPETGRATVIDTGSARVRAAYARRVAALARARPRRRFAARRSTCMDVPVPRVAGQGPRRGADPALLPHARAARGEAVSSPSPSRARAHRCVASAGAASAPRARTPRRSPSVDLLVRVTPGRADVEPGKGVPAHGRARVDEGPRARRRSTSVARAARGPPRGHHAARGRRSRRGDAPLPRLRLHARGRGRAVARLSATPRAGGPLEAITSEPLRLRVRPALDPKAPGAPEGPGPIPPSSKPGPLGRGRRVALLLAVASVVRERARRRARRRHGRGPAPAAGRSGRGDGGAGRARPAAHRPEDGHDERARRRRRRVRRRARVRRARASAVPAARDDVHGAGRRACAGRRRAEGALDARPRVAATS